MAPKTSLLALFLAATRVLADGYSAPSICDKYTTALLKDNTPSNQYTLLTLLVNTVVIGKYVHPPFPPASIHSESHLPLSLL